MGEAARRRTWVGKTLEDGGRYGGRLATYLAQPRDGKVPCGECVACCYHPRIDVLPGDDLQYLDVTPDGALRKRDDGSCIHLVEGRCEVYEHRPHGCRIYDCRILSAVGIDRRFDGDQLAPHWVFDMPTPPEQRFALASRRLLAEREWPSLDELVQAAAKEARNE